MNYYEIFFDLKDSAKDLEFSRDVSAWLGYLQERGLIEGFALKRRKLGFGLPELGEFHITIRTRDLAQLDAAFHRAASRDAEAVPLHSRVYRAVRNARFALYRDYPDPERTTLDD